MHDVSAQGAEYGLGSILGWQIPEPRVKGEVVGDFSLAQIIRGDVACVGVIAGETMDQGQIVARSRAGCGLCRCFAQQPDGIFKVAAESKRQTEIVSDREIVRGLFHAGDIAFLRFLMPAEQIERDARTVDRRAVSAQSRSPLKGGKGLFVKPGLQSGFSKPMQGKCPFGPHISRATVKLHGVHKIATGACRVADTNELLSPAFKIVLLDFLLRRHLTAAGCQHDGRHE